MNLPSVVQHLRAHGIQPTKALGQNFLTDLNLTHKIARAAGPLVGHTVIEIGPGPGGLSRALFEAGAERLIAVEQDRRLAPLLQEIALSFPKFHVHFADALNTDVCALGPPPRRLVANLPYNIATPLLLGWLRQWYDDPGAFASLTLMFQKEVAARLTARPRSKAYGRLSVMAQWICALRPCFDLPPHVFMPPPKVTSTVVHFERHAAIRGDFKAMERVVAAAFGQRRKTLKTAMKTPYPTIEAALEQLKINPLARAEQLRVEHFIALTHLLSIAESKSVGEADA